jgi:hypothetical protein
MGKKDAAAVTLMKSLQRTTFVVTSHPLCRQTERLFETSAIQTCKRKQKKWHNEWNCQQVTSFSQWEPLCCWLRMMLTAPELITLRLLLWL